MTDKLPKILIAEDEKPTANALELKLNHSGFEAKAVYDGEQVLEALDKEKYDLLLLDLVMPKMDGFAILEELKKRGNKIPVIVNTNLQQNEDTKRVEELGVKNHFIKSNTPFTEIIEHIKKVLNER